MHLVQQLADGGCRELELDLPGAGLAPADADAVNFDDSIGALMVRLYSDPDRQVAMLEEWVAWIEIADMIAGRHSKRHPMRYLHVRGRIPDGPPVIVSTGWPAGSPQAELVYADIERQDPETMIARLIGLDGA